MITIALTLLMAAPANAGIAGTAHDFSTTSGPGVQGPSGEICVYCHTPHNANTGMAALWNRGTPAGPYTMYTNAVSGTLDMTVAPSPEGVSLACLSCHDGVAAISQYTNADSSGIAGNGLTTFPAGSTALLDTDLTNDHPISIGYDPGLDADFNTAAAVQTAGLPLYNGGTTANQVECGSCHNPHGVTGAPKFLRMANTASALCLTCHIK